MGVVGGWCWPKSPLSPVVSSQELEALGSPTAPPHVEQRPLEEEVSQQQTAPRSSKDRQPDHRQAPCMASNSHALLGKPSWKPASSGQEIEEKKKTQK